MNQCRIVVNGAPRTMEANLPVGAVVAAITSRTQGVAVALNGTVVPQGQWGDERVGDGDTIEIITAVQGG